jgi:hypothetical protein
MPLCVIASLTKSVTSGLRDCVRSGYKMASSGSRVVRDLFSVSYGYEVASKRSRRNGSSLALPNRVLWHYLNHSLKEIA